MQPVCTLAATCPLHGLGQASVICTPVTQGVVTESASEGQREALWVGMCNGEAAMQTLWWLLKK